MRREERVTVQGPVKEQQPDGLSHGQGGGAEPEGGDDAMTMTIALFSLHRLHVPREEGGRCDSTCLLRTFWPSALS